MVPHGASEGVFGLGAETNLAFLPKHLAVYLFIAALVLYDGRTLGQLHKAKVGGAPANAIPKILHAPIVTSAAYVALTHRSGTHATQ
jgi:hypothetical protein